ncbi:hypothetical protein ACVWXO_000268 [Bradyrhizobium sp. LM2.7]
MSSRPPNLRTLCRSGVRQWYSAQQRRQRRKLYSFHPPAVEYIRNKAAAPHEFGVKASIVNTNGRAPGGRFVLHARALPGNRYGGHSLGTIIGRWKRY